MKRLFSWVFTVVVGTLLSALLLMAIIVGLVVGCATFFMEESKPIKNGSLLEINLAHTITDAPREMSSMEQMVSSMIYGEQRSTALFSTLRALEQAESDDRIVAVSLRGSGLCTTDIALLEEIHGALMLFKKRSGKPIYAYGESFSQREYYLCSLADKICMSELGAVEWRGVAAKTLYYGDMLSRLGIQVETLRPDGCDYKEGVEPFTDSSMSSNSREQAQNLVDEFWDVMVTTVSLGRSLPESTLRHMAQQEVIVESGIALNSKMIDAVCYSDEYDDMLRQMGVKGGDESLRKVSLYSYAASLEKATMVEAEVGDIDDKVAILYIDGAIMDGASNIADGSVGSATISRQLRELQQDDDVKGVVIRVNSPGGSALAADIIWHEVERLQREKPVVVSMGSYAASGGYYVSAPADVILADSFTTTGSIGAYAIAVNGQQALNDKLHIFYDGVVSAPAADMGNYLEPMSFEERRAMLRGLDGVYSTFLSKVSQGRNIPMSVVKVLAGGRLWSGGAAVGCNLADGVGGLRQAISLLVERCNLEVGEYRIYEVRDDSFDLGSLFMGAGVGFGGLYERVKGDIKILTQSRGGLITHSAVKIDI